MVPGSTVGGTPSLIKLSILGRWKTNTKENEIQIQNTNLKNEQNVNKKV